GSWSGVVGRGGRARCSAAPGAALLVRAGRGGRSRLAGAGEGRGDPDERVLEVDAGHAVADAASERRADLTLEQRELVADEGPDVRLRDVQVCVQWRVVLGGDAEVAGRRRLPGVGGGLVQQVVRLLEVGALEVAAVGVDGAAVGELAPDDGAGVVEHVGGAVGRVAEEGLVLDHAGEASGVEEALYGELLV